MTPSGTSFLAPLLTFPGVWAPPVAVVWTESPAFWGTSESSCSPQTKTPITLSRKNPTLQTNKVPYVLDSPRSRVSLSPTHVDKCPWRVMSVSVPGSYNLDQVTKGLDRRRLGGVPVQFLCLNVRVLGVLLPIKTSSTLRRFKHLMTMSSEKDFF